MKRKVSPNISIEAAESATESKMKSLEEVELPCSAGTVEEKVSPTVSNVSSLVNSDQVFQLGSNDFLSVITGKNKYVDKTLFIKDWWESHIQVALITRPRRFGKSFNLSMLQSFYSIGANADDFKNFKIANHSNFMLKHCGKYPVLFLNFKDCKGDSLNAIITQVWQSICSSAVPFLPIIRQNSRNEWEFDPRKEPSQSLISNALLWLTRTISEIFKQNVIVLIDEYDAPLNTAFKNGFFKEASTFFDKFYSTLLKDNKALLRACLVGIVQVHGCDLMSGLNNVMNHDVSCQIFSDYFGFTKNEMQECCMQENLSVDVAINWYDGYKIGKNDMLNPWSFINYVHYKEANSYWTRTTFQRAFESYLAPVLKDHFSSILILFSEEKPFTVTKLKPYVDYGREKWTLDESLHFLVHTGYLTFADTYQEDGKKYGNVWIPNHEVRLEWTEVLMPLLKDRKVNPFAQKLVESFETFDILSLESIIKEMILNCSFNDLKTENSYHAMIFGLFYGTLHDGSVNVFSNQESGHGLFDICVESREQEKAFIFEFKHSKNKKNLEKDTRDAMDQLKSRNYQHRFKDYTCVLIAMSFYKKHLSKPIWEVVQPEE